MKTTAKSTAKTTAARPVRSQRKHHAAPRNDVTISKAEIRPLVIQARKAFDFQLDLGNIDRDTSFDIWRHQQVHSCCGASGVSSLSRAQWREVMAHFLCLTGLQDQALPLLMKTGPKRSTSPPDDTYENSETYVALMRAALDEHQTTPDTHPKGKITPGWLLAAARQRTGRPTLTLETMAERLDPETLRGLLSHLRNHISRREGREDAGRRSERIYPVPADPGEMDTV